MDTAGTLTSKFTNIAEELTLRRAMKSRNARGRDLGFIFLKLKGAIFIQQNPHTECQ